MAKTKPQPKSVRLWRGFATLVLLLAAIYLLSRHTDTLWHSLRVARQAQLGWVLTGFGLTVLTFALAAGIYMALALKPLRYRFTLLIELAAAFANRLLPAGLGSLGLHGLYLYKQRHTTAQATAVVSVNNLLGIATHITLLLVLIGVRPEVLQRLTVQGNASQWWFVAAAALLLAVSLALPAVRRKLVKFAANLLASFRLMQPGRVLAAVLFAVLLTTTYTLILLSAAHAVGVHLGLLEVFVVFSAGMLAGTATPTPGGLVGAEAGLFAGFVAYGVSAPSAGAAVLIYRLLTYWLPLIPGVFALVLARQRKLV